MAAPCIDSVGRPWFRKCVIYGCDSTKGLHAFPNKITYSQIFNLWCEKAGIKETKVYLKFCICSKHFAFDDFHVFKQLKKNAVPSLNFPEKINIVTDDLFYTEMDNIELEDNCINKNIDINSKTKPKKSLLTFDQLEQFCINMFLNLSSLFTLKWTETGLILSIISDEEPFN